MATKQLYNFRAAHPDVEAALNACGPRERSAFINAALKEYIRPGKTPAPRIIELWEDMARDLVGLSTNTNQLARWANMQEWTPVKMSAENLKELAAEANSIYRRLQKLLGFWES